MSNIEKLPKRKCPQCGGTGCVYDDREIGAALQHEREASGITLREIGRRLKFSAAYISDLEHGRRGWNAERISNYRKALKP